jgi:hypothetical protein
MISAHGRAFLGLRSAGLRAKRCRAISAPANRRSRRRCCRYLEAGLVQLNSIWPLSLFHKIDLIVRFRLAGVRIRGHEEG